MNRAVGSSAGWVVGGGLVSAMWMREGVLRRVGLVEKGCESNN